MHYAAAERTAATHGAKARNRGMRPTIGTRADPARGVSAETPGHRPPRGATRILSTGSTTEEMLDRHFVALMPLTGHPIPTFVSAGPYRRVTRDTLQNGALCRRSRAAFCRYHCMAGVCLHLCVAGHQATRPLVGQFLHTLYRE